MLQRWGGFEPVYEIKQNPDSTRERGLECFGALLLFLWPQLVKDLLSGQVFAPLHFGTLLARHCL